MYVETIKLKIFVDNVARTIIGEEVENNNDVLVIKNPCTIYIQPNDKGQLQVQTIPLFFKEFLTLDGRDQGVLFTFLKTNIVDSNAADLLDQKLKDQYNQIISNFTAPDPISPVTTGDTEVVKLFDE
jgi:hypothetical protein